MSICLMCVYLKSHLGFKCLVLFQEVPKQSIESMSILLGYRFCKESIINNCQCWKWELFNDTPKNLRRYLVTKYEHRTSKDYSALFNRDPGYKVCKRYLYQNDLIERRRREVVLISHTTLTCGRLGSCKRHLSHNGRPKQNPRNGMEKSNRIPPSLLFPRESNGYI